MRLLIYCFIIIYITGCGYIKEYYLAVDDRLVTYVKTFELDYNVNIGTMPVILGDTPKGLNGLCRYITNKNKDIIKGTKVIINEKYYNKYKDNYYIIHQLVYHELGHCLLKLKHDNELIEQGIPKSIMFERSFNYNIYRQNIYYYINEMRGK